MIVRQTSLLKDFHIKVLLVLGCTLVYFYAFKVNLVLFDWLNFSHGTNWIFLPSGLRLLFVLVLIQSGAVGVAIASCLINFVYGEDGLYTFKIVTGIISGSAPLIARQICIDYFKLDPNIKNLTSKMYFIVSVVFAFISGFMHQIWYYWNGATDNFLASALVMSIGDWCGSVLILATASLLIKFYRIVTTGS